MSWPNRITVLRLLLVTPFILLLVNAASSPAYRYGAMAHYALMISALVTMSIPGILSSDPAVPPLPLWVSVTLVSRDVFMLFGASIIFLLAGVFQGLPSATGKAATVMQFVTVVVMCAAPDLVPLAPEAVGVGFNILWGLTVALGVLSWLGYIRMGSRLLTAGGHGS